MAILPTRQVHLDFHNSPLIPDVGADFCPADFARAMRDAAVDSVTVFARCHHGMCYYPSRIGPVHPGLKRDLLGEMIEALHREGIQAPIYMTVTWDEHAADAHPDWRQVDRSGAFVGRPQFSGDWGWKWVCLNSPYVDYLAALTEEVCRSYPVDGLWFDILRQTRPGCVCGHCLPDLRSQGLDPAVDSDLMRHSLQIERATMRRLTGLAQRYHPRARIYYNGYPRLDPDPSTGIPGEADSFSFFDLESLASGGWGYAHFPLFARYYQTLGKEIAGMTARFHLSWADFGALKNPAALEYECFRHLALGAANVVGDQLHPRGRLDPAAYELIGGVYKQVQAVEPWCVGAYPLADIAVLLPGRISDQQANPARDSLEGATRLLAETHHQFQIVDHATDLSPYRVVILPDEVVVGDALATRLREYLSAGGALLLSFRSGLGPGGGGFALDEIGLDFETVLPDPARGTLSAKGAAPRDFLWQPNSAYIRVDAESPLRGDLPPHDYVVLEPVARVCPRPGTETLATEVAPYFDRTWEHISSHRQTPPDKTSGFPMVTRRGNVIYFAAPVFRAFQTYGNRVFKALVANALAKLMPEPLLRTSLPSGGEATVLAQPAGPKGTRMISHLLYYTPQRRTKLIDIIEDVVPLRDVQVAIRADIRPTRVILAPQGIELPFETMNGYVRCVVPEVRGHQIVVVE